MVKILEHVVTIFVRPFTLGFLIGLLAWIAGECFFHGVLGIGGDSSAWWGILLGACLLALYSARQLFYGLTWDQRLAFVAACVTGVVLVVMYVVVIWDLDTNRIVARFLVPCIHIPIDSAVPWLLANGLLFGAFGGLTSVAVDCYTSKDVKSNYQRSYDMGFLKRATTEDRTLAARMRDVYENLPRTVQEALRSRVQANDPEKH